MKMFTLGLRGLDIEVEAEMFEQWDGTFETEFTLVYEGEELNWQLDHKEMKKLDDKYIEICFQDYQESGI